MSAEKPEVGDVFKNDEGMIFYLFNVYNSFYELFFNNQGFIRTVMAYDKDLKQLNYLGKSKDNINDLFEVKDD